MKRLLVAQKCFLKWINFKSLHFLISCWVLAIFWGCSLPSGQDISISLDRCSELLYAAQDALEKERFFEAEFYSLKCLEENPYNASALDMLGLSRLERGDIEKAKFYFDAIKTADPNYDYLHHRLSLVNFYLKNFEDCRKHFWIAYDLNPVDPQTQALKQALEEEGIIN